MPARFLPDYGLYLLNKGVRPETRLVFFELPVEHLTRPDLRTVCLTLSTSAHGWKNCWRSSPNRSRNPSGAGWKTGIRWGSTGRSRPRPSCFPSKPP